MNVGETLDLEKLAPIERAVFDQALCALSLPLYAREAWFVHVAQSMSKTNQLLGWNGRTIN